MTIPMDVITLRATTPEEIEKLNEGKIEWIKSRLKFYSHYDPMTCNVFVKAGVLELTDEETMILLAYEALSALQESQQLILNLYKDNLMISHPMPGG